jgi:hypothetical protein
MRESIFDVIGVDRLSAEYSYEPLPTDTDPEYVKEYNLRDILKELEKLDIGIGDIDVL